MGLEHSKPVAQLQANDVATIVEQLGKHYEDAAKSIRENGVDGIFLASLSPKEVKETLDDLGVQNRLHRRVLERKLAAALEGGRPNIISWDLEAASLPSPPGLRRTNTLDSAYSGRSAYTTGSLRSQKSFEQKEEEAKKLLAIMTEAAEQQMLERYALLEKEKDLKSQIQMVKSTNEAA